MASLGLALWLTALVPAAQLLSRDAPCHEEARVTMGCTATVRVCGGTASGQRSIVNVKVIARSRGPSVVSGSRPRIGYPRMG